MSLGCLSINTLRQRQNGRHLPDNIFKCIFLNENVWISLEISLKFVPKVPINNIPQLVLIMAWRRPGNKPLLYPLHNEVVGGYIGFTPSVRLSVRRSVCPASLPRPSRIPCPLCNFYSSGCIHFIFIHLIKQLQKVCRVQSFLQNFKIWSFGNFFKFVTLTLCCLDLGSDVNH